MLFVVLYVLVKYDYDIPTLTSVLLCRGAGAASGCGGVGASSVGPG